MDDRTPGRPAVSSGLTGTGPIIPARHAHRAPVWHYTDAAGVAGIVTGGSIAHGCLWATAATMLNDLDELKYGTQRISTWYEQQGNAEVGSSAVHIAIRSTLGSLPESILANPAYVVSASTDGDSLGQWRGYAGASGYAVELDPGHEYMVVGRPDPDTSYSLDPAWVKVAYEPEEQDSLIESVFAYILDQTSLVGRAVGSDDATAAHQLVSGLLSGLAAVLKHPSFKDEKEVRLVAFRPDGVVPSFRGTTRGVIPYLTVATAVFPNLLHPAPSSPLPINSIRVGPPHGVAMEQRVRGVRILLDTTGRSDVPVNRSDIPFIP
jgi:hypothetical protein